MDTTSAQAAAPETGSPSLISGREREQIDRANATTATPVVFIHGLWLLPSSWDPWAALFEQAGYVALTPDWPDDPETVEGARAEPEVLANKTLKQVGDHTAEVMTGLDKKPVLIGHSTGGLLAEILAGHGLSAATVAIDPEFSAAFCHCRSPCSVGGPLPHRPAQRGRRSRSRSTSSGMAGRTTWTRTRRWSYTTSSMSPPPGSRSRRWATRTSTHGRRPR